jgi:hypothetical protein
LPTQQEGSNAGRRPFGHEENGWPPKAAAAKAKEVYGVVRATVYAAKKRRKEAMELLEPQPEPKASP